MLKVKSPGKIMLAGEWSVLESGNLCIVMTVDKFVEASIIAVDYKPLLRPFDKLRASGVNESARGEPVEPFQRIH